jgi:DNA-binding MarR family transcriptional regulator
MSKSAVRLVDSEKIDLGEFSSSLGFLLRIAQVQVFNALFETLAQVNVKPGEFTVLWVIGLNPQLRQGSLAQRLEIKPAHMTKLVQRLVQAGYVIRSTPEDDRRSVRLSLTNNGRALLAQHKADFLDLHKQERGNLSASESKQLCNLLRKFTHLAD